MCDIASDIDIPEILLISHIFTELQYLAFVYRVERSRPSIRESAGRATALILGLALTGIVAGVERLVLRSSKVTPSRVSSSRMSRETEG